MTNQNITPSLNASSRITVLTAENQVTVKAFRIDANNQLKVIPYGREKYFYHRSYPVSNIADLANLVTRASHGRKDIIIRGHAISGISALTDRVTANFPESDNGTHWVMLDLDNLSVPDGINPNSVEAIEHHILKLPKTFHDVTYFYQFSSSAGIVKPDGIPLKTGLNVHLFFWLKQPITGAQLSAYLECHCLTTGFFNKARDRDGLPLIKLGVDLSVIKSSVQPLYVGLPILGTGVTCTITAAARQDLIKKTVHEVELPVMPTTLVSDAASLRRNTANDWKCECGLTPTKMITRLPTGGISTSNYYRSQHGPSPATNKVFSHAEAYGNDAVILYFDAENSPGSYYVNRSRPQLAVRFGDATTIQLKELSDGAFAYVRDELKWFSEIRHVELSLTEAGFMPAIAPLLTARNTLILAPTGSGKSTAFCELVKTIENTVIIYAAQTIALVDQMMADLKKHGEYRIPPSRYNYLGVPWAVRYSEHHKNRPLWKGTVYVTTNESLYKFVDAAIARGVNYVLVPLN